MADYLQVTSTFGSKEEAQRVARALVEGRLAACAQVAGPISSIYWWQGSIEEAEEWLCIAKTTSENYAKVEETIRRLHSYEVPEILATPVAAGSADYLRWLRQELRQG